MKALQSTAFGVLLIIAAAILLFWNEGRAVTTARSLQEGAGLVVEVDSAKVDPALEGKLIHISGALKPEGTPADTEFGLQAPGSLRLERTVEMYQWKEVSKDVEQTGSDGKKSTNTVYDYEKDWSDAAVDSADFKMAAAPKNPPMPLKSRIFAVDEVSVGAYRLLGSDLSGLGADTPLVLNQDGAKVFATLFGSSRPVTLVDNRYFIGADPKVPAIGDLRIGYRKINLDKLSAVGGQSGNRLGNFTTSNGRDLLLVREGIVPAKAMFADAIAGNKVMTWVLRVVGLAIMFFGFLLSFSVLTGLADYVPVLGGLVRAGAGLLAFALTALLGAIIIGLGWLFYRPLLGCAIVAAGIIISGGLTYLSRNRQGAERAA